MPTHQTERPRKSHILGRAIIEVSFIIFLFYANLLMGEFTASNGHGKTLAFALRDIITKSNFYIACISALIGFFVFEFLRKKFY
jgi:hypothetical protein